MGLERECNGSSTWCSFREAESSPVPVVAHNSLYHSSQRVSALFWPTRAASIYVVHKHTHRQTLTYIKSLFQSKSFIPEIYNNKVYIHAKKNRTVL